MQTVAVLAFFAIVAVSCAGVLKDVTGGTYDLHTGQYSSALTGHVYNTAPVAAHAPVLTAAHAPVLAAAHAPVLTAAHAPVLTAAHAPVLTAAHAPVLTAAAAPALGYAHGLYGGLYL